jgi:hypothetical protein
MSRFAFPFFVIISLLFTGGCAAIIAGGATGTQKLLEYTFENVARKTFTTKLNTVRDVSVEALEQMGLSHEKTGQTDTGFEISARTKGLTVEIEIEQVTRQVSRVTVNAKRGWFRKDYATAKEIVQRMELLIDRQITQAMKSSREDDGPLILLIP